MIWVETLGRYYILSGQALSQAQLNQQESFSAIEDPLTMLL